MSHKTRQKERSIRRHEKKKRAAERFLDELFGTPRYIVAQTVVVAIWIALNSLAVTLEWDPYPFILLNLAFSTQAAYAAPFILLAQTRQADRDKAHQEVSVRHRDELAEAQVRLVEENTAMTKQVSELTQEIESLTRKIHEHLAEAER